MRSLIREPVSAFILMVGGVFTLALLYMGGLGFEAYEDEVHFWEQTQYFADDWPPTLDLIRSYPEPMTPLSFLAWAGLEASFGGGIAVGRLVNLLFGLSILALFGLGTRGPDRDWAPVLSAAGLLAFPYFIPMSLHLYTDISAAFFVLAGVKLFTEERLGWSGVAFALAIATRQYMVAFPAGLVAAALSPSLLRGEFDRVRWRAMAPIILSGLTLFAWMAFFKGAGPAAGLENWERHTLAMSSLTPRYGLYFVTCIGVYFVVPELVLFRRWAFIEELRSRKSLVLAGLLLVAFVVFPVIDPYWAYGPINRVAMWVLPPDEMPVTSYVVRSVAFYFFAWLACVRFARPNFVSWMILSNAVLMIAVFSAWEKYALPLLVCLWFLRSTDRLDPEVDAL